MSGYLIVQVATFRGVSRLVIVKTLSASLHLQYEVDIIKEELYAEEKIKRHVRSPFFRLLLPPLRGNFGEFGIRIDKEKFIVWGFYRKRVHVKFLYTKNTEKLAI